MSNVHEKRRFIEAAVLVMMLSMQYIPPTQRTPRHLVNKAGELWDEIEAQTKENTSEDD